MKASSMQNHFDVTRSKCRQTKPIVWATLLILMSRHADRSSSSLYLADLRSMQYGCKFATVCVRKPFQSQKSRSWRSFSRLEVSEGSRNQAIAPNSKINCCLITSAPPTLLYSRSTIVPTSIAASNHLTNARKPP